MDNMLATLAELHRTVERLEELSAWDQLKELNGPRAALPFWQINDQINDDVRDLYGLFCQLDQTLRQALNRPNLACSPEALSDWDRGLSQLEARVRKLRLPERFINR